MPVQEVGTLYCTKCGTRLLDGGKCTNACDTQNRSALSPAGRVPSCQIPGVVGSKLTKAQADGLGFSAKNLIVKSAVVQSFNLGSTSVGTVKFVGAARSFGPWAVFGGMGSINQATVNSYRTDVQLKLEDDAGRKSFLSYSLPFAITLALEPGDTLRVYFVRGGLQKPTAPGDFRIDAWSPFLAENPETGQLLPIVGLPTLGAPSAGLAQAAVVCTVITLFVIAVSPTAGAVFFTLFSLPLIAGAIQRARKYKAGLSEAARAVATLTV